MKRIRTRKKEKKKENQNRNDPFSPSNIVLQYQKRIQGKKKKKRGKKKRKERKKKEKEEKEDIPGMRRNAFSREAFGAE